MEDALLTAGGVGIAGDEGASSRDKSCGGGGLLRWGRQQGVVR